MYNNFFKIKTMIIFFNNLNYKYKLQINTFNEYNITINYNIVFFLFII